MKQWLLQKLLSTEVLLLITLYDSAQPGARQTVRTILKQSTDFQKRLHTTKD
jgi:hypothetical protein